MTGTTNPDETRHRLYELTAAHLNAIDALVSGASINEAAEAARVSRQTVSVWRNHHFGFIAEMNRRRAELDAARLDIMLNLDLAALEVVSAAVGEGDASAALAWLKMRRVAAVAIDVPSASSASDVHDEFAGRVLARPDNQKDVLERMLEENSGKMTMADARREASMEASVALVRVEESSESR